MYEQVQWHRFLLAVHMRFTERIQESFALHQPLQRFVESKRRHAAIRNNKLLVAR